MKKIFVGVLGCMMSLTAEAVPAMVDYILDGDTFAAMVQLQDDISVSVRVRILDIDTPEIHGDCAEEINAAYRAKDRLSELLPVGEVVDLQNIKDDKYLGRIDANVITSDNRNVSNILIQEGLARKYGGGKRQSWCK